MNNNTNYLRVALLIMLSQSSPCLAMESKEVVVEKQQKTITFRELPVDILKHLFTLTGDASPAQTVRAVLSHRRVCSQWYMLFTNPHVLRHLFSKCTRQNLSISRWHIYKLFLIYVLSIDFFISHLKKRTKGLVPILQAAEVQDITAGAKEEDNEKIVLDAIINPGDMEDIMLAMNAERYYRNNPSFNSWPLHWAAVDGHLELAKALLDSGADLEGKEQAGFRPLHYAAHEGNSELVKEFISRGADVKAQTKQGWTIVDLAANREKSKDE